MNELVNFEAGTMDSREIAGLTGRRHDSIIRTIKKMCGELGVDAHIWELTPTFGSASTWEIMAKSDLAINSQSVSA